MDTPLPAAAPAKAPLSERIPLLGVHGLDETNALRAEIRILESQLAASDDAIRGLIAQRDEQRVRAERAEANWRLSERLRGTQMNKWHAASYSIGWADGAEKTRKADVEVVSRAMGTNDAFVTLNRLPLPVCPEGPPAGTGDNKE